MRPGIVQGPTDVENGVRITHDPDDRDRSQTPTTSRCLRHHVWMASCGDCREAHAPILQRARETGPRKS